MWVFIRLELCPIIFIEFDSSLNLHRIFLDTRIFSLFYKHNKDKPSTNIR